MLVPVTVTDRNGKTIKGLQARDFKIVEDQTPQQIVSFTSEDAPCAVGLVLDVSGSMRYALGTTKYIAKAFIGTANPEDEFLLIAVATQPEMISGFTADTETLQKRIQYTRPGGMTSLIDAVYFGLNRMREARRPRRALLILTDGMDNNSRYSKGELMQAALEADVQIYTIIVDGIAYTSTNTIPFHPSLATKPIGQAQQGQGRSLLEELSDKTGGLHFR